jgi:predicted HicB family RNase H-like nuclease
MRYHWDMSPQQDQASIHVRLPPALHDQLRDLAEEQRMSLNALVIALLSGGIGFKLDGKR